MLLPVKGEPVISHPQRGCWEYCWDPFEKRHVYLHLDCDMVTDRTGHCVGCGQPCPTLWTIPPIPPNVPNVAITKAP